MFCDNVIAGAYLICRRCGHKAKYRGKPYYKKCAVPCPYLGQPREETVTLSLLCGCKAKRTRTEKTLIVFDCAVQGRCLPGYSCTRDAATEDVVSGEWAEPCRGCEKRPTPGQAAAAASE